MPDNPHVAQIAPARNLAGDILEEIFFQAADSPANDDPLQPLRSFTMVNRHWHLVYHSSPRLWRNLGHICVDDRDCPAGDEPQPFIESLEHRLGRATTTQPLTFYLSTPGWTYNPSPQVYRTTQRVFSLLALRASQWEGISLSMTARAISALGGALTGRSLPLLEKLSIEIRGTGRPSRLDYFSSAPRLRHVEIKFCRIEIGNVVRDNLCLPWSQLLSYHEQAPPIPNSDDFYVILTTTPHLQSHICTLPLNPQLNFPAAPLGHKALTRLHLKFTSPDSSVLRRLTLPSLKDLSVTSFGIMTIFSDIASLIRRSSCQLQALAILPVCKTWHERSGELSQVLELCPNLTRLCVNSIPPKDTEILAEIDRSTLGSGPIVPALRQLTVCYTVMFPMDEDYAGFDDLARARERMFHDGHTANLLEMSVGMVHYSPFEDQVWAWVLGSLERFPFLYMPEMDQIRKWAEVLHAQLNRKWFDTRRRKGVW
ncbi:hypothetical protein DFP72DRAFT_1164301 [Ephemerocybe angulata]|uniref:F-box domain-containing protein n=1 Tax=Ephemerocybe angulata TaxID=980116 RepID=A0A8H6MBS8_9AGAR|nr:hypothetical protein DFP72DRAFT_1164301 [Tulosesus angulatus]